MVKNATNHPDLVEDIAPNDNEATHTERRTVMLSGQKVVCPLPSSLTGWDNLRAIPYITSAHCMMYLVIKRGWSASRIASYEKERGYLLYMEKHIHNVRLKQLDYGISCIRASCTRQTRQNEQPYDVWLFVASNGDIQTAGCQCIGWVLQLKELVYNTWPRQQINRYIKNHIKMFFSAEKNCILRYGRWVAPTAILISNVCHFISGKDRR